MSVPTETAPSCPACGVGVAAGARFCSSCGAALALSCPGCGQPASGRFCSNCGTALDDAEPPAAVEPQRTAVISERRLTSVLFGDLVGFTPLSEARDPELVREILSRYFAVAGTVIQRYGGTVEKFIGDAVMAVWGVPTAQEDDAERAVRAGMDLVDAIAALGDEIGAPGLAMRVGIVTGEVAATIGATGEGMVAGDAVNTAARIQSTAAPGEVWVDQTTRSLTAAAVAYTDAGLHPLKGKSEPVALYAARHVVAAVGGSQRVDGLEAPFVGRDREMRLVKELFHATLEEGRPRLVAVTGTAGVGKSRLGWEFFKYVDGIRDIVRWHRGRCPSYGDGVAFWALAEVVRGRLDILEGDEPVAVVDKLLAGLEQWVPDADERAWLTPRLATLLNVVDAVAPDASFGRDDLFSSWQLFFERLAEGAAGVALLIEDLQWADDGLLDFLDHLLTRSQAPIFVVALARPDLSERRPGWSSGRRVTPVYLEPLGDAAMGSIIDGLVEGLPDPAREALVAKAEGIPLFAVETVRALIDRDAVLPQEGRYVFAGADTALELDSGSAPTSLHTLIAARLDALTPEERRAVQNAAVLGLSFTRRGLQELMSTSESDVDIDALLDALVRKEILTLESDRFSSERGQYRFVQAMVRSVAYDTLSRRDRKARHLQAAAYLAGESDADDFSAVLAAHLIDARAAGPDDPDADELAARAVDLLERAARRADGLGSPAQAIKHYTLALSLGVEDDVVGRLAHAAAESAIIARRLDDAVQYSEQAAAAYERAGLPVEHGSALAARGEAQLLAGQGAGVPDVLIPVYESLQSVPGATPALTRVARVIGRSFFLGRGDARGSFIWWDRALELAEGEEDWQLLAESMSSYGAALLSVGRPTLGLGVVRIALEIAREKDLPNTLLQPLNNLASFLAARDATAARNYVDEGLALAHRLGDQASGSYLSATAMCVFWISGDWDRATALFGEEGSADLVMGVAYVTVISEDRGTEPPELPGAEADQREGPQNHAPLLLLQALRLGREGDAQGALKAATAALQMFHEFAGYDDDFPIFWTCAFDRALDADDLDEAARIVRLVAEAPRGMVSPLLRALLPYLRARLGGRTGADPALIEADFEAGTSGLRAFGARYFLARCLLDRAEWLGRDDRGADAVELAREATEIFESLRAEPWVRRCGRVTALALR